MILSPQIKRTLLSVAVLSFVSAAIVAQDASQESEDQVRECTARINETSGLGVVRPSRDETAAAFGKSDAQIAACVIIDCLNQVSLASLAEEKSRNQATRGFAQAVLRDQRRFIDALQPIASSGGYTAENLTNNTRIAYRVVRPSEAPRLTGQDADVKRETAEEAVARAEAEKVRATVGTDRNAFDVVSIRQQISRGTLAAMRRSLEADQSPIFDRNYIALQYAGQMQFVETLEALKEYASTDLVRVLDAGLRESREHARQAENLQRSAW